MEAIREFLRALPGWLPELGPWFGVDGWYLVASGIAFTAAGLVCGYFIWRKGYHQTLDAEAEVKRTAAELQRLREDLHSEEAGLGSPGAP